MDSRPRRSAAGALRPAGIYCAREVSPDPEKPVFRDPCGGAFSRAIVERKCSALPVLFAVYLLLVERKHAFNPANGCLVAAWVIIGAGYLLLRNAAMAGLPAGGTFGIVPLIGNIRTLPELFTGLVIPWDIPAMPSFTLLSTIAGSCAVAAITIILGIRGRLGRPMVLLGALWFIALSIAGMMYRQELGGHAFNYLNHRSYLPMVGIWIVILEALRDIPRSVSRKMLAVAGSVIIAALILLAHRQSAFFADPAALYSQAIRTNPRSAFALNNRASLRAASGDVQGAQNDIDCALRLDPDFPAGLLNRGILAAYNHDTANACRFWQHAARLGNSMARDLAMRYCGKR